MNFLSPEPIQFNMSRGRERMWTHVGMIEEKKYFIDMSVKIDIIVEDNDR
jgi:hypothetical protein